MNEFKVGDRVKFSRNQHGVTYDDIGEIHSFYERDGIEYYQVAKDGSDVRRI